MKQALYDKLCSVCDRFVSEIQFHATRQDALEGMGYEEGDDLDSYPGMPDNYGHYAIVDYRVFKETRQAVGWGNSDLEALQMATRQIVDEFNRVQSDVLKPLALAEKYLKDEI